MTREKNVTATALAINSQFSPEIHNYSIYQGNQP